MNFKSAFVKRIPQITREISAIPPQHTIVFPFSGQNFNLVDQASQCLVHIGKFFFYLILRAMLLQNILVKCPCDLESIFTIRKQIEDFLICFKNNLMMKRTESHFSCPIVPTA